MKEFQTAFLRPADAEHAPVVTIPEKRTQEGDLPEVTLAKINALLAMIKSQTNRRSGVIVDEAGIERAVRRKVANVAANASHTELVALVAAKKIRVLGMIALCDATATDLTLESHETAITPLLSNAANGGEVLPFCEHGWCETAAGVKLAVTTSNDGITGLLILYALIPNYLTDENGIVLTDENGVPLIAD